MPNRLDTEWKCPEPECSFGTDWLPSKGKHKAMHQRANGQAPPTRRLAKPWACACGFNTDSPQGKAAHQAMHRRRLANVSVEPELATEVAEDSPNRLLARPRRGVRARKELLDHRFVPGDLVNREASYEHLAEIFEPVIQGTGHAVALLTGDTGVGKTALARRFAADLCEVRKGTRIVYQQCRSARSLNSILTAAMQQLDARYPDRGYSPFEVLRDVQRWANARQSPVVFILDDIETACLRDAGDLAFLFSRLEGDLISCILIDANFNTRDFEDAGLQTLGLTRHVHLEALGHDDVVDLVRYRLRQALGPRHTEFTDGQLHRISTSVQDQPRFALEAVRLAIDHAVGQVTEEDVRYALTRCGQTDVLRRRHGLTQHELLVHDAVLQDSERTWISGELEAAYQRHCQKLCLEPVAHTRFWVILNNLERAGLIAKQLSGKGQMGTTQLINAVIPGA